MCLIISVLCSVDTLAEASSLLSDVKVLEVKDNVIRLFLTGPIFTSDGLLMGQKLDLSLEKPVNSDHELLIEFAEGNMELKKMEVSPFYYVENFPLLPCTVILVHGLTSYV